MAWYSANGTGLVRTTQRSKCTYDDAPLWKVGYRSCNRVSSAENPSVERALTITVRGRNDDINHKVAEQGEAVEGIFTANVFKGLIHFRTQKGQINHHVRRRVPRHGHGLLPGKGPSWRGYSAGHTPCVVQRARYDRGWSSCNQISAYTPRLKRRIITHGRSRSY